MFYFIYSYNVVIPLMLWVLYVILFYFILFILLYPDVMGNYVLRSPDVITSYVLANGINKNYSYYVNVIDVVVTGVRCY